MGYYIETPTSRNKARWIVDNLDGTLCTYDEAREAVIDGEGVVVVVHNPAFEAAGFAYDADEFDRMTDARDPRPREYVLIDYAVAAKRSGYYPPEGSTGEVSKPTPSSSPSDLTTGVESTMAVSADPPTVEPKPTIYPHHFVITCLRRNPSTVEYEVTRIGSSPWPSNNDLYKICDDGWESWLRGEPPSHFGGRIDNESPNSRIVCVYID